MDAQTYSVLASRTVKDLGREGDLIHATLGIVSEAGEIADTVKKTVAYGKPFDATNILEELGDLAWFMNLMITQCGCTWDQVFAANIAKLEARYPNFQFTVENAVNRDKAAERAAVENVQTR